MPANQFLERFTSRLERIDRKSLEDHVRDLNSRTRFLADLLDEIQEALLVFNEKKEILYMNRRAVQLFNISESLVKKSTLDQIITDEPLARLVGDAIEKHREFFGVEVEALLPRPMTLKLTLTFDPAVKPFLFHLSILNTTQSELNIRERFQLENMETMMGLAAGIAHEIGNPLNSLMIHLKLLTKNLDRLPQTEKKKLAASIEIMTDETKRLDQIIRNFLGATRRKPLQFESVQINELLEKTISFLKPELKSSKIKVEEGYDEKMPAFLLDPERLRQAFINIVKNAIHAMPKGGTLKVFTHVKNKLCMIQFRDSGIGIPEEKLSKIFDAYFTTKEEGTGLGLMIVSQIIREHGGRIEVMSKPNSGSTFTIVLPIRTQKLGLPEPKSER